MPSLLNVCPTFGYNINPGCAVCQCNISRVNVKVTTIFTFYNTFYNRGRVKDYMHVSGQYNARSFICFINKFLGEVLGNCLQYYFLISLTGPVGTGPGF